MGAWAYSVSHPSVFQHHFWTGVLVREWEEREEAGQHPASGKQTGRETVVPFQNSSSAIFVQYEITGAAKFPHEPDPKIVAAPCSIPSTPPNKSKI